MMLNKKIKLFSFNNFIILFFIVLLVITLNSFSTIKLENTSKRYAIKFTKFYPGDATGSTKTLGSGLTNNDFTTDENGWYYYSFNGTKYLVIAAATTYCRDASNHCGIDIQKHGMAKNIRYFGYYDTLVLNIGGKNYNAMVLDSCGACMWSSADKEGERYDIFTNGKGSTNPDIYSSTSSVVSANQSSTSLIGGLSEYFGNYTGNIKEGYLYKRQKNNALSPYKKQSDEAIEAHEKIIINNIFNRVNKYSSIASGDYEVPIIGEVGDALTWKQYDSKWGNIKLGTQGETIKGVGCLVTSVSIQIKISGTQVNTENFNPGTWVNYLNQNNGFSGSLFKWNKSSWNGLVPNWDIVSSGKSLPKDKAGKIEAVKSYLAQGYYPIMCVKANCGHWVAVTGATDNDIIMADPGSSSTSVFTKYKVNNVTRVALFKKND